MMASLLHDYRQNVGDSFRYRNLSTNNIDSYQGNSALNKKSFIFQCIT
ncbi:hypothetical protein ROG8370_02239 [Roseovarius gaetbuli]|uniref:Uncharacterized protein n=1 Tax=Roseovarius gaetbuli TaxID=1356575 RepID=A0A1X6ZGL6_9RHOB|nr:hypothetical protein ROG8370_02239 [Roseovarius gaetbuli]